MKASRLLCHWRDSAAASLFRGAVSLHSHTSCSKETFGVLPYLCSKAPGLTAARIRYERKFRESYGHAINYGNGWWTPPLTPFQAWSLETAQIGDTLGLGPLVSLTDHDNIDAAKRLRLLEETREAPISVEWTVPLETELHVGVHNLPPGMASEAMGEFTRFAGRTPQPRPASDSRLATRHARSAHRPEPSTLGRTEEGPGEAHRNRPTLYPELPAGTWTPWN